MRRVRNPSSFRKQTRSIPSSHLCSACCVMTDGKPAVPSRWLRSPPAAPVHMSFDEAAGILVVGERRGGDGDRGECAGRAGHAHPRRCRRRGFRGGTDREPRCAAALPRRRGDSGLRQPALRGRAPEFRARAERRGCRYQPALDRHGKSRRHPGTWWVLSLPNRVRPRRSAAPSPGPSAVGSWARSANLRIMNSFMRNSEQRCR